MKPPDNLPASLADCIGSVTWHLHNEGDSDARVFRLHSDTVYYLKTTSVKSSTPVYDDYVRYQWLTDKIPIPQILHYATNDDTQFLLMSNCGEFFPFHDDLSWSISDRIDSLARIARQLHTLPVETCPYRLTVDAQIDRAKANLANPTFRSRIGDKLMQGHSEADIVREFETRKPQGYDPVVTHGDLYPVNMRVMGGDTQSIDGVIDVGMLAVADRYTDLAPIVNAIGWHYEPQWIDYFFQQYGVAIDREKLRFYQTLHLFL